MSSPNSKSPDNSLALARPATAPLSVAVSPASGIGMPMEPPGGVNLAAVLLKVLREYAWSIALVFLLAGALGVGGIWALISPSYQATAMIEVSPIVRQLLDGQDDQVPLYESYRASQAELIKSPVVLNAVLDSPEVRATAWYKGEPGSKLERWLAGAGVQLPVDPPLDRLLEQLEAVAPKGKQLVLVQMSTPRPGEAKIIVDAVLEAYLRFTNARASASDTELMAKLRKEIADRDVQIEQLQSVAAQLRQRLGTGTPEELVKTRAMQVLALESQVNELRTQLEIAKRSLDTLNGEKAASQSTEDAGETGSEDTFAAGALDPRWQQLKDRVTQTERAVKRRAARFGPEDPVLRDLNSDLEAARDELAAWEDRLRETKPELLASSPVDAIEQQIRELTIRVDSKTRWLEQERVASKQFFNDAEELARTQGDIGGAIELRGQLRRRLDEMRMNREVAGLVRTYEANEPHGPAEDQRKKLMLAAMLGAIGLSVGQAFARYKLNATIRGVDEVLIENNMALLGRVPLQASGDAAAPDGCPLTRESMRLIRTSLLRMLDGKRGVVVQITSATSGCGKSSIAASLSRSLAEMGKRVLLVDADLRRPSLARVFGVQPLNSLADAIHDPAMRAEAVYPTSVPNLDLVPTRRCAGYHELDRLSNGDFSGLLDAWKQEYEVVVLDSPPLLGIADAAILSRAADGSVLVARERYCRRDDVNEALRLLRSAGGRLLGTVYLGSFSKREYSYDYAYLAAGQGAELDA